MAANVEPDFDETLKEVARRIYENEDIDNLGKALGFLAADVGRFIQTNTRHHEVDYSGTLSMLRQWQERQSEAKQREALIDALLKAHLYDIIKELFPGYKLDNLVKEEKNYPPKVTDVHIRNLSKLLHTTHYYSLSTALGIKYSIAEGIEREKMRSYPDMYIKLLHTWNVESNKTLKQLDRALREAGAGGLVSQYKPKNVR